MNMVQIGRISETLVMHGVCLLTWLYSGGKLFQWKEKKVIYGDMESSDAYMQHFVSDLVIVGRLTA